MVSKLRYRGGESYRAADKPEPEIEDKVYSGGLPWPIATEEDAPEGWRVCTICKGQRLVGSDGESCFCTRFGDRPGYEKKPLEDNLTDPWCALIGAARAFVEHSDPHDSMMIPVGESRELTRSAVAYAKTLKKERKARRKNPK